MAKLQAFEIQVVSGAFSGKIPPHLWRTVGRASTQTGAYRHYARQWAWYHPQQNAWTGHVRIRWNGQPCAVDHVTHEISLYDPETGRQSQIPSGVAR